MYGKGRVNRQRADIVASKAEGLQRGVLLEHILQRLRAFGADPVAPEVQRAERGIRPGTAAVGAGFSDQSILKCMVERDKVSKTP